MEERYTWSISVDGLNVAGGECFSQPSAVSTAFHYASQYVEEMKGRFYLQIKKVKPSKS